MQDSKGDVINGDRYSIRCVRSITFLCASHAIRVYIFSIILNCCQQFFPRVIRTKMQLHTFALIFLYQSFANGNPLLNVDGGLAELEKRTSSFPDLVPTTTVNLKTDSTLSSQIVSPARSGTATVIIHSATTTTAAPSSSQTTASNTRVTPSPDNTGSSSLATISSSGASSTTQNQGGHHHHTTTAAGNTAASSSKASSAAQSTSSQGGAGTTNTVPLIGMLFLGLLGI